ncbi:hypothetical protein Dimus_030083 [Dionaea muscipula]
MAKRGRPRRVVAASVMTKGKAIGKDALDSSNSSLNPKAGLVANLGDLEVGGIGGSDDVLGDADCSQELVDVVIQDVPQVMPYVQAVTGQPQEQILGSVAGRCGHCGRWGHKSVGCKVEMQPGVRHVMAWARKYVGSSHARRSGPGLKVGDGSGSGNSHGLSGDSSEDWQVAAGKHCARQSAGKSGGGSNQLELSLPNKFGSLSGSDSLASQSEIPQGDSVASTSHDHRSMECQGPE